MDKKCVQCGAELEEGAIFCGECGSKYEAPVQKDRSCSKCGAVLEEEADFCGECGTKYGAAPMSQEVQGVKPSRDKKSMKGVKTLLVVSSIAFVLVVLMGVLVAQSDRIKGALFSSDVDKAYEYLDTGEELKAMLLFEEVLSKDRNDVEALEGLATIYLAKGDEQKAIDIYEQILGIDPTNAEIKGKYEALLGDKNTAVTPSVSPETTASKEPETTPVEDTTEASTDAPETTSEEETTEAPIEAEITSGADYERIMIIDELMYFYDTLDLEGATIDRGVLTVNGTITYESANPEIGISAISFDIFFDEVFESEYLDQLLTFEIELYSGDQVIHVATIENFIFMDQMSKIPEGAQHVMVENIEDLEGGISASVESLHIFDYNSQVNFDDLTNVTYLFLYDCYVGKDIAKLEQLNKIVLFECEVEFDAIMALTSLKQLFVFECEGIASDVSGFSRMSELQTLEIYGYNDLTGDISAFGELEELITLSIDGNVITGDVTSLSNPKLTTANIGGNVD